MPAIAHAQLFQEPLDCLGCELRAIVAAKIHRTAAYQEQVTQQLDHVVLLDARGYLRGQTFPGEFVHHIQDADLATILQPLLDVSRSFGPRTTAGIWLC